MTEWGIGDRTAGTHESDVAYRIVGEMRCQSPKERIERWLHGLHEQNLGGPGCIQYPAKFAGARRGGLFAENGAMCCKRAQRVV